MVCKGRPGLSIARQCDLLNLSCSAFYYKPVGLDADTLSVMKAIDQIFTQYPFFGSRQARACLRREDIAVGRHRVRRLMRMMGLEAIYKRPRTTTLHPAHPVYPYLLKGMTIDRPNQVWCADITFIPVRRGFLYLVAVMDWTTRKVLSWRLSNTMHASFCLDALDEAIAKHGAPEIINTDQRSQFTGAGWITMLTEAGVKVSMDGRGRCMDKYLHRTVLALVEAGGRLPVGANGWLPRSQGIKEWVGFYNTWRPHSALEHRTPADAYWAGRVEMQAA